MAAVGVIWTRKQEPILVDPADLEMLSVYTWRIDSYGRAVTSIKRWPTAMHKLLLPNACIVDHINHDPADNRRCNLREATTFQNLANRRKWAGCTSRYKGVSWHKLNKKWQARISVAGKRTTLGMFDTEEAARDAYNIQAAALHGAYACLDPVEYWGGTPASIQTKYRG